MNIIIKEATVLTELIKLADHMDRSGDFDGATKVDAIINSFAKNNLKNKEMINSILSLADDLDANGLESFADKIQSLLTKAAEDDEDDKGDADNTSMSLNDLIKKLDENNLGSATMELDGWRISVYKDQSEEDCGCKD